MAISEFKKMQKVLNTCPLCEQDDKPPVAPVISLGTRVFLTLQTEPELSSGGAIIVPIQHRVNMMECDDDEWEEVRVSRDTCCILVACHLIASFRIEFHESLDSDV